jgi:hypothetical protein
MIAERYWYWSELLMFWGFIGVVKLGLNVSVSFSDHVSMNSKCRIPMYSKGLISYKHRESHRNSKNKSEIVGRDAFGRNIFHIKSDIIGYAFPHQGGTRGIAWILHIFTFKIKITSEVHVIKLISILKLLDEMHLAATFSISNLISSGMRFHIKGAPEVSLEYYTSLRLKLKLHQRCM